MRRTLIALAYLACLKASGSLYAGVLVIALLIRHAVARGRSQ